MSVLRERSRESRLAAPLEEQFAERLGRLAGEADERVRLAVALLVRRVAEAHVCLDLAELAATPPLEAASFPPLEAWCEALGRSPLARGESSPLVLDGTRLYFRRHYLFETAVAGAIERRAAAPVHDVDEDLLRDGLRRLFPSRANPDWQRVAAAVAVLRRVSLVTGGPGTGKTWTVARILALLVEQALTRGGRPPRVALLAPTGKAAARLRESIRESRRNLACPDAVREAIPEETATLHRALGARTAGGFAYDESRPLPADVVVVDEASMVDLGLMRALLAAVPERARLVLLGDRDQLASVEAGSVLADLCGGERAERVSSFSPAMAERLERIAGDRVPVAGEPAPALRDGVVYLQESRRFAERPGIGRVAEAIRAAAGPSGVARLLEAIRDGGQELRYVGPGAAFDGTLAALACEGYRPYLAERTPARKLERFGAFRILSAHRTGPDGVEALNPLVEQALGSRRLLRPAGTSYENRPILVTRNDPGSGLFNGDTGIVVAGAADGALKAAFPALELAPADSEAIRLVSLSRLPAHETAFAITVHKSQGSEFDEVAIVLPRSESRALTRELLYTAITRARDRVTIFASAEALERAARTPTRRGSGLAERLWGRAPAGSASGEPREPLRPA